MTKIKTLKDIEFKSYNWVSGDKLLGKCSICQEEVENIITKCKCNKLAEEDIIKEIKKEGLLWFEEFELVGLNLGGFRDAKPETIAKIAMQCFIAHFFNLNSKDNPKITEGHLIKL